MNNIDLDRIIRPANGLTPVSSSEEKLITINLASGRAVEKNLLLRALGNYQDYLVANNLNPLHSVNGKLLGYYVHDTGASRTLAIDISLIAIGCPPGKEGKVAEAFHGPQAPGQVLEGLLKRWVGDFIRPGNEWEFIENYHIAHKQLEQHIRIRAAAQTGLELTAQVSLSGEGTVAGEIVIGPIELGIRLLRYAEEQKLTVEAGLVLDPENYVKAFVFDEKLEAPEEFFKRRLKEYFFQHVTFSQFTYRLHYPDFKDELRQKLNHSLKQIGRIVQFINFSIDPRSVHEHPREFVAVDYNHDHRIPGRTEPVVIQNTVQLYCYDSVKFKASKVADLEAWVKATLRVKLKGHLIGKSYVDLLLRFGAIEQKVRQDVIEAAADIGYRLDHLVSIPDLQKEREELENPFPLETLGEFETSMDKFKVELKFNLRLCIPKLDAIEKYLNPGANVKQAMKEVVLGETQYWMRKIHPERFYLYFNKPNEGASQNAGEEEKLAVKELLSRKIQESLKKEFNARIFDVTLRLGRSDLTERYHDLCFSICQFRVEIASPDPQNTEDLTLTGNLELLGVHPDEHSWRRFSVLQLDLEGLTRQLETHLKSELKTYYQSAFMFQNRMRREQVFSLVRSCAESYMHQEFGLKIHLTNLDRNTTKVEEEHRQFLIGLEKKKLLAEADQCKLLVDRINQLKQRKVQELSVFPIDEERVEAVNHSIKILERELADLSSPRLLQHQLAATSAAELPDEIPPLEDSRPSGPRELPPEIEARLAS